MKRFSRNLIVTGLVTALIAIVTTLPSISPPARAAGPWYVGPGGSDGSNCTSPATRCASINGALNKPGFAAGDTIRVAIGTYTGTGTEVVLLNKNATLSGGWNTGFTTQSGMSTIDGQGARRGVTLNSGVTVTIERFTIKNGYTNFDGGGISDPGGGGTLTLNNSMVSDNIAEGIGGGIFNRSLLMTLNNSTISGNLSGSSGGGIYFDGTTLTLNNSTISGNTANLESGTLGGGIDFFGINLILNSSTISGNKAGYNGGGIYNGIFAFSGSSVTLENSILAGNVALFSEGPDCNGHAFGTLGYNLIGNTSGCNFTPTTGDLINIDPKLGPLEGSPGYHPLLPGSPAINAGSPSGCMGSTGPLTTDQRGFPRFGRCDIGAYEAQAIAFSTKTVNQSTVSPGAAVTYTITVNNGSATNLTNVQVTDTLPIFLTYINKRIMRN